MTEQEALERFAREHQAYNDLSLARRKDQLRVLRALGDHLDVKLVEAGGPEVQSFLALLIEEKAPSTVAKELGLIRPFFSWAFRAKLITGDQLMEIRDLEAPRGSRAGKPRPYKPEQIQAFWRELAAAYPWSHDDDDPERGLWYFARWERDTSKWSRAERYAKRVQIEAIVALALYGGVRRKEIFDLTVDRAHYENDYVAVLGARKNREGKRIERPVPWMAPEMRDAVQAWIDLRARISPGHDGLWLTLTYATHARNPIQWRSFGMLLGDIGRGWEFHRLRHTAATTWLANGMPLERVQRILGHSRIQQTQNYTEVVASDVVSAANKIKSGVSRALRPQPEQEAA